MIFGYKPQKCPSLVFEKGLFNFRALYLVAIAAAVRFSNDEKFHSEKLVINEINFKAI